MLKRVRRERRSAGAVVLSQVNATGLQKALVERGYIVFVAFGDWALKNYQPGDRVKISCDGELIEQPFYILVETNREDFLEHRRVAEFLVPLVERGIGNRYWRVGTD